MALSHEVFGVLRYRSVLGRQQTDLLSPLPTRSGPSKNGPWCSMPDVLGARNVDLHRRDSQHLPIAPDRPPIRIPRKFHSIQAQRSSGDHSKGNGKALGHEMPSVLTLNRSPRVLRLLLAGLGRPVYGNCRPVECATHCRRSRTVIGVEMAKISEALQRPLNSKYLF